MKHSRLYRCLGALALLGWCGQLGAQVHVDGWIPTNHWNILGPLLNNGGAAPGADRMARNWLTPHEIGKEDPKLGDVWGDIVFDQALNPHAESTGFTGGNLAARPTWFNPAALEALAGLPPGIIPGQGDLVDLQEIVNWLDNNANAPVHGQPLHVHMENDNVMFAATTYVNNISGAPLLVGICTSSDDSVQAWINEVRVTNASIARGSSAGCSETSLAYLPSGISKIAMLVWEGGGGWNGRLRFMLNGAPLSNGNGKVEFLGTGVGDPNAKTQIGTTTLGPDYARQVVNRAYDLPLTEAANVVVKDLRPGGDPGEMITLVERISTTPASDISKVDISNINPAGTVSFIEMPRSFNAEGFILPWLLLGPFIHDITGAPNGYAGPGDANVRKDYLRNADGSITELNVTPSAGDTVATDFGATAGGPGLRAGNTRGLNPGNVPTWLRYLEGSGGTIDFNPDFYGADLNDNMVYAVAYVVVNQEMTVHGAVASDDSVQVLVDNTEIIICGNCPRGFGGDNEVQNRSGNFVLTAGVHKVMVKTYEGGGGHGFRFRFENPDNTPIDGGKMSACLDPAGASCENFAELYPLRKVITRSVSRATLAGDGASYTLDTAAPFLAVAMSGNVVNEVGVRGAAYGISNNSRVVIDHRQTGAIGAFDNSHDIGFPLSSDGAQGGWGSTVYDPANDSYSLSGSGDDIWDLGDQFQFAYKRVTGDFVATARITSRSDPAGSRWGKHGWMARWTGAANSSYAMNMSCLAAPGEVVEFNALQFRNGHNTNGTSNDQRRAGAVFAVDNRNSRERPTWIRLIRKGDFFQSFGADQDQNGNPVQWIPQGGYSNAATPDTVLLGMALTSHAGRSVGTITFDNVSILSAEDAFEGVAFGIPSVVGSNDFQAAAVDADAPDAVTVVSSGPFRPKVAAHEGSNRLQLLADGTNSSGTAVWYAMPAAVGGGKAADIGFRVDFDAYLRKGAPVNPTPADSADGVLFAVVEGTSANPDQRDGLAGGGGGAMGFEGGTVRSALVDQGRASFGIEVDAWEGGGANEHFGTNNGRPGRWHTGLDHNGLITSIQTHIDYGRQAGVPEIGLPNVWDPALNGVHFEVEYRPIGDAQASLTVHLSSNNTPQTYARTKVLDAIVQQLGGDLIYGFTGGTGGANMSAFIDNVSVTSFCLENADSLTVVGPTEAEIGKEVTIEAVFAGADGDVQTLWQRAPGVGSIVRPNPARGPTVDVTSNDAGVMELRIASQDASCANRTNAVHKITWGCPELGDTSADTLDVTGPATGFPGTYVATATASDASGDTALKYTFTATSGATTLTVGPQDGASASFEIPNDGAWTFSVSVDDSALCNDPAGTKSVDVTVLPAGAKRRPGDFNRNGEAGLEDAVAILVFTFIDNTIPLPCPGGSEGANNIAILDFNGNGDFTDVADAVGILTRKFVSVNVKHVLGDACVRFIGCGEDACAD